MLIWGVMRLRHPDACVSSGTAPPPTPTKHTWRSDVALLHRLRSNSSFPRARLHQVKRLTSSDCPTCGVQEVLKDIFFQCNDYTVDKRAMIIELHKGKRPHFATRDLFFTGTRSACRATFELTLTFLHLSGLSDRL